MAVITEDRGDASADTGTSYTLSLSDLFLGSFASDFDEDWIRLNLSAGTVYDITLIGVQDAFFTLYDGAGRELVPRALVFDGIALSYRPDVTGEYYLSVNPARVPGEYQIALTENPHAVRERPEGTYDEMADFLTDGYWDWAGEGRRAFAVAPGGTLDANITALGESGQQLARWALASWTSVSGIRFELVDDDDAHIVFSDDDEGAWANSGVSNGVITSSRVNVSAAWVSPGASIDIGAYSVYVHEIGHALGLGHPGPYNGFGSYREHSVFLKDSFQSTVMSYFAQDENTYVQASPAIAVTPMAADIVAIHTLYGAPADSNAGDTVYGYRSGLDGYLGEYFRLLTTVDEAEPAPGTSPGNAGNLPTAFTIYDNGGNDTLDLRTDRDNQRVYLRPEGISDVYGLEGNMIIARDTWVENFVAGSGDDVVVGSAIANDVNGREGNDRIWGGGGDDVLEGGAGADRLDGDAGVDWAAYRDSDMPVTINLAAGIVRGAHAEGDVLIEIEGIIGSAYDDVLVGNGAANRLEGGAGADRLDGGGGTDWLSYRSSDAGVTVSLGRNTLSGGHAQGDRVANFENVSGSAHDDVLTGDNGANQLDGRQGGDVLEGGPGADRLVGGSGGDTASYQHSGRGVTVRLHALTALGGDAEGDRFGNLVNVSYLARDGRFLTETVPDIEHLRGSGHADILAGDSRANHLEGGAGADRLYGGPGGGDDVLVGGSGNDSLYGGMGDDALEGGAGADLLRGGIGADSAVYRRSDTGVEVYLASGITRGGHARGDQIFDIENVIGSAHADVLGGDGDANVLEGGPGADRLDGGGGIDWLSYLGSDAGVTVNLRDGTVAGGHARGDVISGFENVVGSGHRDVLRGDNGANELSGHGGADELYGNAGNDVLAGGAGADRLDGGAGMDTLSYRLSGAGVRVDLARGTGAGADAEGDTFISMENVLGSAYRDLLRGDAGANHLDGGPGADELYGAGGADRLSGNRGTDELHGDAGADELRGNAGNDRLYGGTGADLLQGDEGDY